VARRLARNLSASKRANQPTTLDQSAHPMVVERFCVKNKTKKQKTKNKKQKKQSTYTDGVDVSVDGLTSHFGRGLEEGTHVDVPSEIRETRGDHLGA
jgi:hypothetical protein